MKPLFPLLLILTVVSCFAAQASDTSIVEAREIATKVVLDGHIEAIKEATVTAQISAVVKQIYVDVDDKVSAGRLLVELDNTEISAQLAKAKAGLKVAQAQAVSAQSEYARLRGLANDRFVSENDITKASSAVNVAQANIKLAQAQIAQVQQMLSYTKVIAPYSGVVTARHIEPGETAKIGQALLSGFALNQNRLLVHVPNSLINEVEKQGVLLAQTGQGDWLTLSNLTIAPSADPTTHTVMVRTNVDKALFQQRPGSFIKVAVKTKPRQALTIPSSAVFQQGDLQAVYVKFEQTYLLRQVLLGERTADYVEVLSGLTQGDEVIADGSEFLALYPVNKKP